MNKTKIQKLFATARQENCPGPSASFAEDTLRLVRQQPMGSPLSPAPATLNHQLSSLFSTVSLTCVSIIILAVALDWGLTAAGFPQPEDSAPTANSQLFFTPDEMGI
jgi:hypothetical protein